jgi:methionine-rich copper-binding protein CopC
MLRITRPLLALITALALASPAIAHVKLVASTPSDGAILAVPVSKLELVFSKILRLTNVRVTRQNDSKDIPLAGSLPNDAAERISISVEPLPSGNYTVDWTGVSRDGHVMKGTFSFTVATAEATQPPQ